MSQVQLHLALTHVPVLLSLIGLILLSISLIRKNDSLLKTSCGLFVSGAITVIPVYFSGEGAEEAVEHLPGVTELIIEHHEEMAQFSAVAMGISGILALAVLLLFKNHSIQKLLRILLLASALGTAILMAQTAHLGGQIRHTEIQTGRPAVPESGKEPLPAKSGDANDAATPGKEKDKDDD